MLRRNCAAVIVGPILLIAAGVLTSVAETVVVAGTFATEVSGHDAYGATVWDTGGGVDYLVVKTYHYPDYDVHPVFQDIENFIFAYDSPDTEWTEDLTDIYGNPYRLSDWGQQLSQPHRSNNVPVGDYAVINEFTAELTSTLDGMPSTAPFPADTTLVPPQVRQYLHAGPQTQSSEQVIWDLADSLTYRYPFQHFAMVRIVNWCIDNLDVYEGDDPPPQDALAVINDPSHRATCSGYSHVAIALARAAHIPARMVVGISLDEAYEIASGWSIDPVEGDHPMLEVYSPDTGWVPYDAQIFYHFCDTRFYRFSIGVDEGANTPTFATAPLRAYYHLDVSSADPSAVTVYKAYGSTVSQDYPQLSYVRTIPTPDGMAVADWAVALGVEDTDSWSGYALGWNAPNPFSPGTEISYTVPSEGTPVLVRVFDVAGRLVRTLVDERKGAGKHSVHWDGREDSGERVASGVCFCLMDAPGFQQQRKLVVLK